MSKGNIRISAVSVSCLFGLISILFSASAFSAPLPANIDAGQIEKRFDAVPIPLSKPKATVIPEVIGIEAPEGAENVRLTLSGVNFIGVTVFDADELKSIYADFLDRDITLKDVYELAGSVTRYYSDAGYLLSRAIVPPQTIENNTVSIQVVEGYVDKVLIEGMEGQRPDLFDHYIKQIKASRPLTAKVLERYLLLANELSGVRFKTVMTPSDDNTGATTLTLSATLKSWDGSFNLDNRGSKSSGPWQSLIEFNAHDLMGRLGKTTVRYVTVPNDMDELQYWQLSHQQFLNGEGLRLAIDFTFTDSEPGGAILRQLDVESRNRSGSVSLSYPMIRSREQNLTFVGGLTLRDSQTFQLGAISSDDALTVLKLGFSYDGSDTWGGGGVNQLGVNLHQGIDAFSAHVTSRAQAQPKFTSLSLQARRNQLINKYWSADFRVNMQLGDGSLPSSEQYGLGGESSVRGYEPSEWTGDDAVTASVEFIYHPEAELNDDLQFYSFYDFGKVRRADPIALQESKTDIARAFGVGMRMELFKNSAINFELANPLDLDSDGVQQDWQVYGRLRVSF